MEGWKQGLPPGYDEGTRGAGIRYGRLYTVTACTTNSTSTMFIGDWYASNSNYVSVFDPLPKAEQGSLIALARMELLGINPLRMDPVRKPASVGRARPFRHLPRGKLDRWASLKEKRAAWGIA